jgi:predicted RNA-binding protein YlqC (UPF0109 family)
MKNTLHYIITSIVQNPDAVTIHEEETEGIINFAITADPSDIGKIIGKEGKIIRAIRNVMKIPAIKQGKRINVSLAESTPPPTA